MEEGGFKNSKNCGIKILIAAAAVLLLAGDAGAVSGCDSLASVQEWNGSISFTYINSGSRETVEWDIQQSADVKFALVDIHPFSTNSTKRYAIVGPTGVANLNDRATDYSGPITATLQGSGSPDLFTAILEIDFSACKYKFSFASTIYKTVEIGLPVPVGSGASGYYPIPITSSILSGSADFPAQFWVPLVPANYYVPGGLGHYVDEAGGQLGSASVTWEFKPPLTPGGTEINGTIAGNVINASSGLPIAGATVNAGGMRTSTDTNGHYSISIAPGSYTVTARASGYWSSLASVTVPPGAMVIQDFELQPGEVPGDSDGDGKVNDLELLAYIQAWANGNVNDSDLLAAIANWAQ